MAIAAILAIVVSVGATLMPDTATHWPFAPPECGYSVDFPAEPVVTRMVADDGSKNIAADLVSSHSRLDALCMQDPPELGVVTAPLPDPILPLDRIEKISQALAIQNAELRPLAELGAGCGEVRGFLDSAQGRFQIAARLCVASNSTFIVEAIFPNQQGDPALAKFLESMQPK
jgi:hypothetical protein